jgi:hypothetical protein
MTKDLPKATLDSVAHDSVSDLSAHGKSEPSMARFVFLEADGHRRP